MRRQRSVRSRMTVGAAAYLSAMTLTRLIGFASLAVLGRLLTPHDFGLVALALFFAEAFETVVGRHFETALIRTREPGAEHVATAFTLSALWGLTAAAAIIAIAGPAATLLEAPELAAILPWLAIATAIDSLRNPHFALRYERELKFIRPAALEAIGRFSMAAVSIALAFAWGNYWAIVAGHLALSVAITATTYAMAPVWPGLGLRRWREMLGFSVWLSGANLAGFLSQRIDRVVLAATMSPAIVGQYFMGRRILSVVIAQASRPFNKVVFPGLNKKSGDPVALRAAYNKVQGVVIGLVAPIGVALALAAPELVLLAVGPQWDLAVPVLQALAPVMALLSLNSGVSAMVYISGDTRKLFLRNLLILAINAPLIMFGAWAYGFAGLLIARAVAIALRVYLTLRIASTVTGGATFEPIAKAWRTFAAAAAMAVAMALAGMAAPDMALGLWNAAFALALKLGAGFAVYALVHYALWRANGRPDGLERYVIDLFGQLVARLRRRSE